MYSKSRTQSTQRKNSCDHTPLRYTVVGLCKLTMSWADGDYKRKKRCRADTKDEKASMILLQQAGIEEWAMSFCLVRASVRMVGREKTSWLLIRRRMWRVFPYG